MKTALILSGQPRSVEKTFPLIKQHILDINQPDVFIHTWRDDRLCGRSPVSSGGVVASDPIPENINEIILNLYNPVAIKIERPIEFNEFNFNDNKYPQIKPKNSLSQRYSVRESFKLLLDHAAWTDTTYDYVIRMRFDWAIQMDIDVTTLPTDTITTPNDCPHQGGLNDQFAVAPQHLMLHYVQLFDQIPRLFSYGVPFCDEILLGEHLRSANIVANAIPIPYTIQRSSTGVTNILHTDVI